MKRDLNHVRQFKFPALKRKESTGNIIPNLLDPVGNHGISCHRRGVLPGEASAQVTSYPQKSGIYPGFILVGKTLNPGHRGIGVRILGKKNWATKAILAFAISGPSLPREMGRGGPQRKGSPEAKWGPG